MLTNFKLVFLLNVDEETTLSMHMQAYFYCRMKKITFKKSSE